MANIYWNFIQKITVSSNLVIAPLPSSENHRLLDELGGRSRNRNIYRNRKYL